jgi:hypothetical protein
VKRDENADKISSIEEMLQATVLHITRYLHNEMDFSKLSQKAMAKVRKDEIIEKNKQEEEENNYESKILLKSKESTLLSKKSVVFNTNLIDAI